MKTTKGFNKISRKNKIFGLEFFDFLVLIVLYLIVFLFSKNLFANLAIVLGGYFFLRFYKKGKTQHWTASLVRFLITPRRYFPKKETDKEIFK